jgi:DNA invertase Pin-like site-specific DNA recombinase
MIQMASVFGEQEREIIRSRITLGWTACERRGRSSGGRGEKGRR